MEKISARARWFASKEARENRSGYEVDPELSWASNRDFEERIEAETRAAQAAHEKRMRYRHMVAHAEAHMTHKPFGYEAYPRPRLLDTMMGPSLAVMWGDVNIYRK